jgi:hypothetical protein
VSEQANAESARSCRSEDDGHPATGAGGLDLMEAKQPVFDGGSCRRSASCGGESGRDSPGAGCPGNGLSRFRAETVRAQPAGGQPGAGFGDLDPAGEFEMVASERDGADRYSARECFTGRGRLLARAVADRRELRI